MEHIRIAILDKNDTVLAFMDNDAPKALHYFDDVLTLFVKGSASCFDFATYTNHSDSEYIVEGNKLAFTREGKDYYFNIVKIDADEYVKRVSCYGLFFELLNEALREYEGTDPHTIEWYVNKSIPEGAIEIGINQKIEETKVCKFSQETVLKRLFNIAEEFSAELEFVTHLHDDHSLEKIVINIYAAHDDENQGMGMRRDDKVFHYGKEIKTIKRSVDITELCTAIAPYFKDDDNNTVFITSIPEQKILDSEGRLQYWKPAGSSYIYAPLARDKFPSTLDSSDRFIATRRSYDAFSKEQAYELCLADLKRESNPVVEYVIQGMFDCNVGDTIQIEDDAYDPPLYLEARITEQAISFTNPRRNSTTISNAVEKKSEISQAVKDRIDALAEKNKKYTWVAYADDAQGNGLSVMPEGKKYLGVAVNMADEQVAVTDASVFAWSKIAGEDGQNGVDGADAIVISSGPPANPKLGQLWQVASGLPIKRWNGSGWELHYLSVDNLDVQTLSAICADIGEVTAGKLSSADGKFYVDLGGKKMHFENIQYDAGGTVDIVELGDYGVKIIRAVENGPIIATTRYTADGLLQDLPDGTRTSINFVSGSYRSWDNVTGSGNVRRDLYRINPLEILSNETISRGSSHSVTTEGNLMIEIANASERGRALETIIHGMDTTRRITIHHDATTALYMTVAVTWSGNTATITCPYLLFTGSWSQGTSQKLYVHEV